MKSPNALLQRDYAGLSKVISGGQTGADQAGLAVAKEFNLETGGWAPKGYRTLVGSDESLKTIYGLQETLTTDYSTRTKLNIKSADATVMLATNFSSPGEILTKKLVDQLRKPGIQIDLNSTPHPSLLVDFILLHQVEILNVAGNGDKLGNGKHFNMTVEYLGDCFALLKQHNKLICKN